MIAILLALAICAPSGLPPSVHPWPIGVECDLIRVGSRARRVRWKEGNQRVAEPEWVVLTLKFLGAS